MGGLHHNSFGPVLIAALLAVAPMASLHAQPSPYTTEQLAPGVFAFVRQPAKGVPSDSNVLAIVNAEDVVVVDANIFPESSRQVIAEIRKVTSKPVRYLVNTHWHDDHLSGNAIYRAAYPGLEIIQHPRTRELVLAEVVPSLEKNVRVEYPAAIEKMKRALATGKRSNGEALTPEQRPVLERQLGAYESYVRDMAVTPIVPATITVSDTLTLYRGSRRIVIRHIGGGNTPGDLVVHLPEERILATGDLVVAPVPFAFNAPIGEWADTLRRLKTLDADVLVPGHGDVQRDWTYVDKLIGLLDATWQQVGDALAKGANLEATRAAVTLDALAAQFGGPDGRAAFDQLFREPAIEAVYHTLRPGYTE